MISIRNARLGVRALALVGVALSLPACATITRGSSQEFTVESTPPGARVSTSNGFQCDATPCTFRMPRKDAFRATVSMNGYVTQDHQISSGISGGGAAGMAGNVIFGGVIGAVVDGTSGAMNDLTPNPLVVILRTPEEERAWQADAAERARQAAAAAPAQ
ncbi:MAG: translation initiation factor 2 [Alphaproteobacteria bacterium]|uniref:translation initiation factor 2 n=1 Tax=Brevundimonas sp. TaxID=1871086 RepID=UPI0017E05171|nr:translation initiation factor 2 [Brevundimonas sp.]MBA3050765.1 translation initiation factor 2 [Brevundimonas sp.]MBU3972455.1 translation initiation factor 2 [Alphaproteobacteria bacterium]